MVILEAMAAKLPVAASYVGGIPDMIVNRLSGMLFDPLLSDSIRAAVRHLLKNPKDSQQMAATAHNRALMIHHPASIARKHLEVYRALLKKS